MSFDDFMECVDQLHFERFGNSNKEAATLWDESTWRNLWAENLAPADAFARFEEAWDDAHGGDE